MEATPLLARLVEEPDRAAILLDVDGTLAPIVPRPEEARVPESTREALRRLVGRYTLVACVSGRPSSVAKEIVGVDGIRYAGEHGLELAPGAEEWTERLAAFARNVEWPAEKRKQLTLSFHFRTTRDEQAARTYLRGVADRALQEGLRPRWGRKVLEIRPPLDADKGTAVRQLLDEAALRRALYAGDDATDLDAFRALDGLDVAVRVAVSSAEAPIDLGRAADLVVAGPAALADLLRQL